MSIGALALRSRSPTSCAQAAAAAAEAAWSTHLVVAHESHARVGGTEINADGRSLGAGGFAHTEWRLGGC
jgi:hypothetical protein